MPPRRETTPTMPPSSSEKTTIFMWSVSAPAPMRYSSSVRSSPTNGPPWCRLAPIHTPASSEGITWRDSRARPIATMAGRRLDGPGADATAPASPLCASAGVVNSKRLPSTGSGRSARDMGRDANTPRHRPWPATTVSTASGQPASSAIASSGR